jgi:hypothetical protein
MSDVCTEQWIADRARLRVLREQHPEWTQPRLAQEVGRSLGWGKPMASSLSSNGSNRSNGDLRTLTTS